MANYARLYNDDVDEMMSVLVPSARYRKEHYAYGKFTVPQPHGLHTDHSAEDPDSEGEPICIARIETLGTHYVTGDYRAHDPETQSMLKALRYWIPVPEGQPEEIFDELLKRKMLETIPVKSCDANGCRKRVSKFSNYTTHRRQAARRGTALGIFPEAIQAQLNLQSLREHPLRPLASASPSARAAVGRIGAVSTASDRREPIRCQFRLSFHAGLGDQLRRRRRTSRYRFQ